MKARIEALHKMLTKMGMSPERLRIEWISAAEGVKFAQVVTEMTEQMRALGKEKIKAENEKLRPFIEKMLAKKKPVAATTKA